MERLLLYDIDGTLTRTQNGYVPFNEAVFKSFGVRGDIRSVLPDGNTDPRIVEEIFAKANHAVAIDEPMWQIFEGQLQESYTAAVRQGITTIRPLPGAAELLKSLFAKDDFSQGVVTGNFAATAKVKLDFAGLSSYLFGGAFASDSPHRPDLPGIAKARWETLTGRRIVAERCVIIGDTPKDLEAARHNGMKCLLVGTGRYPVEELVLWRPDACLPDLTDISEVVGTLLGL